MAMDEVESSDAWTRADDAFSRMRWMPLVLADMRDYARERGQDEIADEIDACLKQIDAILKLHEVPTTDLEQ